MKKITEKPSAYLEIERDTLSHVFDDILPQAKERDRIDRALTQLLGYLARELWTIPEYLLVHSNQLQMQSVELLQRQLKLLQGELKAILLLQIDEEH